MTFPCYRCGAPATNVYRRGCRMWDAVVARPPYPTLLHLCDGCEGHVLDKMNATLL